MWTSTRIESLRAAARQAQRRIADLFRAGGMALPSGQRVWGQFLDSSRDNTQHGVYGTSAGIQVLAMDESQNAVAATMQLLETDLKSPQGGIAKAGDGAITYKLCYGAEAHDSLSEDIEAATEIMELLARRQIAGQGWGDFYVSAEARDVYPTVVATSFALLALARYRPYHSRREADEAVGWLARRVLKNGDLRAHELALAALALAELRKRRTLSDEAQDALATLLRKLENAAAGMAASDFERSEIHHYSVAVEARRTNKYLFFLPHCLTALALLKLGTTDRRAKSYVLSVVDYFASRINTSSAFRPSATQKASSLDHLWLYRLLRTFYETPVDKVQPNRFFHWTTAPRWFQHIFAALTLCIGIAASYVITRVTTAWPRTLLATVAAVAIGLFGRALWEFYLKGRTK